MARKKIKFPASESDKVERFKAAVGQEKDISLVVEDDVSPEEAFGGWGTLMTNVWKRVSSSASAMIGFPVEVEVEVEFHDKEKFKGFLAAQLKAGNLPLDEDAVDEDAVDEDEFDDDKVFEDALDDEPARKKEEAARLVVANKTNNKFDALGEADEEEDYEKDPDVVVLKAEDEDFKTQIINAYNTFAKGKDWHVPPERTDEGVKLTFPDETARNDFLKSLAKQKIEFIVKDEAGEILAFSDGNGGVVIKEEGKEAEFDKQYAAYEKAKAGLGGALDDYEDVTRGDPEEDRHKDELRNDDSSRLHKS